MFLSLLSDDAHILWMVLLTYFTQFFNIWMALSFVCFAVNKFTFFPCACVLCSPFSHVLVCFVSLADTCCWHAIYVLCIIMYLYFSICYVYCTFAVYIGDCYFHTSFCYFRTIITKMGVKFPFIYPVLKVTFVICTLLLSRCRL